MSTLGELFSDRTRSVKPRDTGITHVIDSGMSLSQLSSLIEVAEDYVDILKFGWATSVVAKNFAQKIAWLRSRPIRVCCGGTLFEIAFMRRKVDEFVDCLKDHGFKLIEISDGAVEYPRSEKLRYIEKLAKDFTVVSEVGSKDASKSPRSPGQWVAQIEEELAAGAWKVITEGRESGTVGLFNADGSVQVALVEEIAARIDVSRLIFEAPQRQQQIFMIKTFGNNVNLGNVAPTDVISLETIRQKLRADTISQPSEHERPRPVATRSVSSAPQG